MSSREHDAATLKKLLSDDHVEIRKLLGEFLQAVHGNNWASADAIFTNLEQLITRHIVFEEKDVFPVFADHPELSPGLPLNEMIAQHDVIRKALDDTGIALQLHQIREAPMQQLADSIDKHATAEDAWAAAALDVVHSHSAAATIFSRLRSLLTREG
ncbi:MAG: hemerythrin domain-containing protein [Deltaproteobacteria bacterium]|nr:hemerythrin domain-containing protein [Deltaproteobacteria bacterium]